MKGGELHMADIPSVASENSTFEMDLANLLGTIAKLKFDVSQFIEATNFENPTNAQPFQKTAQNYLNIATESLQNLADLARLYYNIENKPGSSNCSLPAPYATKL